MLIAFMSGIVVKCDWVQKVILILQGMSSEMQQVCERLDSTLFRLMESLKELSSLRNRYQEVVKEVGIIWS